MGKKRFVAHVDDVLPVVAVCHGFMGLYGTEYFFSADISTAYPEEAAVEVDTQRRQKESYKLVVKQ